MLYYASKLFWPIASPSNILLASVFAGFALTFATHHRVWGRRLLVLGGLGLAIGWYSPLANIILLPLEQSFPTFREDGRPVHGVVVLSGSVDADLSFARDQLVSNGSSDRLIAMSDLARRHPNAQIVYTGGSGAVLPGRASEAVAVSRYIGTLGIAHGRVLFETESRTTHENAVRTTGLLSRRPGERWLLVTSARHMPRALGCFRAAGLQVTAYPVDFRTRGPQDALRVPPVASLDLALKEWVGLVVYRVAGYTDTLFPRYQDP